MTTEESNRAEIGIHGNVGDGRGARREPSRPDTSRRLPALIIVMCVVAWVFLNVGEQDPETRGWIRLILPSPRAQSNDDVARVFTASDPPIGATVLIPGQSGVERVPTCAAFLVIMMGSCSECAFNHMPGADGISASVPGLRTIGVVDSPLSGIEPFRAQHNLMMSIVRDEKHTLSRKYNAAWTPRAYLVSSRGELLWLQKSWLFRADEVEEAARRAVARREH